MMLTPERASVGLTASMVAAMLAIPMWAQAPRRGSASAVSQVDSASQAQASAATYRDMEVDPGVFYATVLDRPDVRIGHVRVLPGGTRRMHTHDDVTFHLMVPLDGSVRLTIGSDAPPIEAKAGQAYFMKAHTPHAFTNTTAAQVDIIEVFVKPAPKDGLANGAAVPSAGDALALALAAAGGSPWERDK